MRTRRRPGRPIGQPTETALAGIATQPLVHSLASHAVAARDLDHRRALEHLQDRPIPLLHDIQLHQHDRLLPDDHEIARKADNQRREREPSESVAHLPERLSPTYRNRVRNLSPRNRNPGVKHEPEKHSTLLEFHAVRVRTAAPVIDLHEGRMTR